MTTKKYYTKEFLDALTEALDNCAALGTPTVLLYRRAGKLDIRVKIDVTPPTNIILPLIFQEGK